MPLLLPLESGLAGILVWYADLLLCLSFVCQHIYQFTYYCTHLYSVAVIKCVFQIDFDLDVFGGCVRSALRTARRRTLGG